MYLVGSPMALQDTTAGDHHVDAARQADQPALREDRKSADPLGGQEDGDRGQRFVGARGLRIRCHQLTHQHGLELASTAGTPQVAVRQDPDEIPVQDHRKVAEATLLQGLERLLAGVVGETGRGERVMCSSMGGSASGAMSPWRQASA